MNKVPHWKEQIVAEVPKTERHYITFQMPRDLKLLLMAAAELRGISKLAYVRRAVMSFVAYDLNLDYYDIMRDEMTMPYGKRGRPYMKQTAGRGFGKWVIKDVGE